MRSTILYAVEFLALLAALIITWRGVRSPREFVVVIVTSIIALAVLVILKLWVLTIGPVILIGYHVYMTYFFNIVDEEQPALPTPKAATPILDEPKANYCAECGAPLPEGAVYCTNCGEGVREPLFTRRSE